jgi:hypothetical protein
LVFPAGEHFISDQELVSTMGRLFFRALALTSVVAVTAYLALDPVLPEFDAAGWMSKFSQTSVEQPVTTAAVLPECAGANCPVQAPAPVVTAIMPSATVVEQASATVFDASAAGAAAVAAAAVASAEAEAPRPRREAIPAKPEQAAAVPAPEARPHAATPASAPRSRTAGERSASAETSPNSGSLKDARPAPRQAPARQARDGEWVGSTFGRGG